MRLILKSFVVVTIVINGIFCGLCGNNREKKIPNFEKIFKPLDEYTINPEHILDDYNEYKSALNGAKASLATVNDDENASKVATMLQSNVVQFDVWVQNIQEIEKANQNYVSIIYHTDKQSIDAKREAIKEFKREHSDKLIALVNEHENTASRQLINLERISVMIQEEMEDQKTKAEEISRLIADKSPSLKQVLEDVKNKSARNTEKMLEIAHEIGDCNIAKAEMWQTVQKLAYRMPSIKKENIAKSFKKSSSSKL